VLSCGIGIGLAGVVSLLASVGLSTKHPTLSLGCFCFGIAWTLIFAIYQTGRFWMGDNKPETLTPILYLPMVAGAFVSASAWAAMGYVDWGKLGFGGGLLTWFALESVILLRLYTARPVLPPLRPTMGLQFAAPAVGAVAYLSVGGGAPDIFAYALIGYALLHALILLVSTSRSHAGLVEFQLRSCFAAHQDSGAIATLAPYLFIAGNIVIAAITIVTVKWAFSGVPQPPPAVQTVDQECTSRFGDVLRVPRKFS
jgi:tellurite resistance protein